jgi:hypothetical protein
MPLRKPLLFLLLLVSTFKVKVLITLNVLTRGRGNSRGFLSGIVLRC